jgi:HlyD family secretion protein
MQVNNRKKGNAKWWVLGVMLVLIAAGVAYKALQGDDAVLVAVESVTRRSITESVNANGKLYPRQEVKVSADASGEVVALYVQEGDTVRAGQVLARIQPDIYESGVDQAAAAVNISRSNLASGQADMGRLNAQLSQAKQAFERAEQLYTKGIVSKVEFENAQLAYQTAQAGLAAAKQGINASKYSIQNSQAGLRQAKDNLSKTVIVAPIGGVVSKLNVEKGERVVGTMQMAGTELLRIADFGGFEATVKVGESDVLRVSVGDTAMVEVDAYLDKKFVGLVTEVASSTAGAMDMASVSDQQVSNYELKIQLLASSYVDLLEKNPIPFRPGMNCSASIQTETVHDVLSVPLQCITTRNDGDDSMKTTKEYKEQVLAVKDGKVSLVAVKSGIQNSKFIELIEGLDAGAQVVVAPYIAISKTLKNGDKVSVVDKKKLFEKKE